jgi:hypothetical protein
MSNPNVNLEDVLNALMLEEPRPSYEALLRWSERYPQYRDELARFFATWGIQAAQSEEVEIDEEKIVAEGVKHALEILRRQGRLVPKAEIESLASFDQLVLTAVFLLRGEGHSAKVTEKLNEISESRAYLASVFSSLDKLESLGLIESSYIEEEGQTKRYFKTTLQGEHALARARETSKQLADLLGDFA